MKPDSSSNAEGDDYLDWLYQQIKEEHPDWSQERVAYEFVDRLNVEIRLRPELNAFVVEAVILKELYSLKGLSVGQLTPGQKNIFKRGMNMGIAYADDGKVSLRFRDD